MKIKVCGMKYPDNIAALAKLSVDLMGMIFYPRSARYIEDLSEKDTRLITNSEANIQRVGVFVNEDLNTIKSFITKYKLKYIQLHGNEPIDVCQNIEKETPVIKAFSISVRTDFEQTLAYEGSCSFFLFDTKTPKHGGSGQKFDWRMLDAYQGNTPFFLSGGISANDAQTIKTIKHPMLYGIDLNSRFEIEAGRKDINLLNQFIKEIKS